MIRSMTAFARREAKLDLGTLIWELRGVNHRYLEVTFRMPEDLRSLEGQLRERATTRLGRGKLECYLNFRPAPERSEGIVVNEQLASALVAVTHKLEAVMTNPARISALEVLQWPGVIVEPERDNAPLFAAALGAFDEAIAELIEGREREGVRLSAFIEQRCAAVVELIAKVRARRLQVLAAQRQKLQARIAELEVAPDPNRLEQELVFMAHKLDIEEELDRLDSHCTELSKALGRNEPVGRRLDFLMQEFNREANTVASKSGDAETTQLAVDLKVLIEQMREQVQNIE